MLCVLDTATMKWSCLGATVHTSANVCLCVLHFVRIVMRSLITANWVVVRSGFGTIAQQSCEQSLLTSFVFHRVIRSRMCAQHENILECEGFYTRFTIHSYARAIENWNIHIIFYELFVWRTHTDTQSQSHNALTYSSRSSSNTNIYTYCICIAMW